MTNLRATAMIFMAWMSVLAVYAQEAAVPVGKEPPKAAPLVEVISLSEIQAFPASDYIIEIFDAPIVMDESSRKITIEPLPGVDPMFRRTATFAVIQDSEAFITTEDKAKSLPIDREISGLNPEGRYVKPLKPVAAIGIRSKF